MVVALVAFALVAHVNLPTIHSVQPGFGTLRCIGRASGTSCAASGYEREQGDAAHIDVVQVERLLSERSNARSARNWKLADSLRDDLGAMGVVVQDNERMWFVGDQRHQKPVRSQRYERPSRDDLERRVDLNDGNAYTKAEFVSFYGGSREWQMSPAPRGAPRGAPREQAAFSEQRQRRSERDKRRMAARSRPYRRAEECTAQLDHKTLYAIDELVSQRLRKKLDRRFDEAVRDTQTRLAPWLAFLPPPPPLIARPSPPLPWAGCAAIGARNDGRHRLGRHALVARRWPLVCLCLRPFGRASRANGQRDRTRRQACARSYAKPCEGALSS